MSLGGAIHYYVDVVFNAALAYVLGVQIGGGGARRLRTMLIALALLAVLIAAHGIVQAQTGEFLFVTPTWASWLAYKANYTLFGTNTIRAGSFLINPDNFGTYMAMMLPILLGLGVAVERIWAKVAVFASAAVIALGLLYSYSTAAFLATAVGVFAAFLFVARGWARLYLPLVIFVLGGMLAVVFPGPVQVLIAHATAPRELSLRVGVWETALNVISHNPLSGIGIGYTNYLTRSNLYRVPQQDLPLTHPHNSFLELAAGGGIPVMLLYLAVMLLSFAAALRNYSRARGSDRVLIGAVIVALIVLSVNSLATIGWTFPPLTVLGWLLLGTVASPTLTPPAADDGHGETVVETPAQSPTPVLAASSAAPGRDLSPPARLDGATP